MLVEWDIIGLILRLKMVQLSEIGKNSVDISGLPDLKKKHVAGGIKLGSDYRFRSVALNHFKIASRNLLHVG